jgi:hypothetical protein
VQFKPDLSGAFSVKGDLKKNTCDFTGGIGVGVQATLRAGLPNLASVGGGAKVEGTTTIAATWSESSGWSLGPLTLELSGAPVLTGQIGPMEFTTSFKSYKLVTVTLGASGGLSAAPGPEVKALWDALTGWDEASYKASLAACQTDMGNDDPNCSTAGGGGPSAGGPNARPPGNDGAGGNDGASDYD